MAQETNDKLTVGDLRKLLGTFPADVEVYVDWGDYGAPLTADSFSLDEMSDNSTRFNICAVREMY